MAPSSILADRTEDLLMNVGSVGDFYRNKSVFVTGASGFLGKVLIHKLLTSCPGVSNIFVLIREKKGVLPEDRLVKLLDAPIFESVPKSQTQKVQVVGGDILQPHLGLSAQDERRLVDEVSVVFHSAATVKFDEEMTLSVGMNVLGTKRMLDLAKRMRQLSAFVHVSTAYAHCDKKVIEERFMLEDRIDVEGIVEDCERRRLANEPFTAEETREMIGARPNTYTFTKAMAEQVVSDETGRLPIVVVRPSIVVASLKEPIPGWIDNFNGPTGMVAGAGVGIFRTLYAHRDCIADLVPVDVVINLMCVAAAAIANRRDSIPIYNCTSGAKNPIKWGQIEQGSLKYIREYPMENILWYPGGSFKSNYYHDRVCRFLFHLLPAVTVDLLMKALGKRPFLGRICDRMNKAMEALEYFTTHEWTWTNQRTDALLASMPIEERRNFDFDLSRMDWDLYLRTYVLGTRRFVLKGKPETIEECRVKLNRMLYLHYGLVFGACILAGLFLCYYASLLV